jgi:hypothetical protein
MGFRTKLDLSDNRQAKQRERTSTTYSGSSVFGLPFSGLTNGPDDDNVTVDELINSVNSTFSGNSGTTIWTFGDSRMSIAESTLSAITPSNSATTQNTDDVFVVATSTVIDGNTVNLTYTGVSYDMTIASMTDIGGGSYTGSGLTNTLEIISAPGLDYTGSTIWVDVPEILRTKKLIVTSNVSQEIKDVVITSTATTLDLTTGNIFRFDLTGTTELDYQYPNIGMYDIIIENQTTGSTLNFASSKWMASSGATPTLTATSGATDMLNCAYDGNKMIIKQIITDIQDI